MKRHLFSTSSSYVQSILGLHRLHALALQGQNDSAEADEIRAGLERIWYDLSTIEQDRIDGLSEDLYSISDPPPALEPTNPQVQRKLIEAFEARQVSKWDLALSILRRWNRFIDPALLSFLRGTIWQEAGDNETAGLFFEHAARLAPRSYENVFLANLRKTDPNTAIKFAKDVFDMELEHSPATVVTAAHILFDAVRTRPIADSRGVLEQMIPVIERALIHSNNGYTSVYMIFDEYHIWSDGLRALASLLLAGCFERLGDSRKAIHHLNAALAIEPDDAAILETRGILRYGVNPEALDDFRRAAALGSPNVWPCFYLAHSALLSNQFDECLKMCESGLTYRTSDEVRANFHEWLAISRFELGDPPDRVRSSFEEAIRLAPDADRIRQNFATFNDTLDHPEKLRGGWIIPNFSTVKSYGRSEVVPLLHSIPRAA